jgi:hypothetical protein
MIMKLAKDFEYRTPQVTIRFKAGQSLPDDAEIVSAAKKAGAIEKEKANGNGSANPRAKSDSVNLKG